jgi:hypothetical protein
MRRGEERYLISNPNACPKPFNAAEVLTNILLVCRTMKERLARVA